MKKQYEIAVIGGGPAGGMTAWKAAGMGALTILLERDREIGIPVRCGEMATLDVFERYFPIKEKLIANRIIAEEFISPDFKSTLIKLGDKSVILEWNKKFLSKYSRLWKKEIGNKQKINYKIKNSVLKMNDEELCRINGLARKASSEKMTLTKFLKLVIKSNPKLLAEILICK